LLISLGGTQNFVIRPEGKEEAFSEVEEKKKKKEKRKEKKLPFLPSPKQYLLPKGNFSLLLWTRLYVFN